MVSDVRCIYVETAEDEWGYAQRYWVSVDTGLLVVAERLQKGETVYRMAALSGRPDGAGSGAVHPAGRHGAGRGIMRRGGILPEREIPARKGCGLSDGLNTAEHHGT